MYPHQCYRDGAVPLNGLGISLTPPRWLREAAANAFKSATVRVNTPAGPIDLSPADAAAALKSARITVGADRMPASSPAEAISRGVESIPGGWLTVAGLGLAAVFVLPRLVKAMR